MQPADSLDIYATGRRAVHAWIKEMLQLAWVAAALLAVLTAGKEEVKGSSKATHSNYLAFVV